MTVSCPDCHSVFRVDPAKVPATGVRARCSVCGGVIAISAGTLPVAVTPSSSGAVHQGVLGASASATPRGKMTPQRPFASSASAASNPPVSAAVMTPPAPIGLPGLGAAPQRPLSRPPASATPSVSGTPLAADTVPLVQAPATPSAGTPSTSRRPINPFLHADPGQRARRLARALVSDLIAYNPQKREEGLRDGTLRQLFREEIKKSFEEYIEQVGRELADSSPYFQDALNDILGGGRKLF